MLHHWLGWLSLAICVLLLAKYIGRISNNKKANQLLRAIHKPLGIIIIAVTGLHGLICFLKSPQRAVQNISGLILLALLIVLTASFYARAKLKSKWFQLHRFSALVFWVGMMIHILISV